MNKDFFVSSSACLQDALVSISKNKHRIVFVVNKKGSVIGSFSDGDFRRILEKDSQIPPLSAQVGNYCNRNFAFIKSIDQKKDHRKLFREGISVVPVLNEQNKCLSLWFNDKLNSFESLGIGVGYPSYVIAEIGNNHNGDYDKARTLVKEAVAAGAHCVKFQMRSLNDLYALDKESNFDLGSEYTLSLLKRYSLSDDQLLKLFDYILELGADPLCTPWDKVSADKLNEFGMRFFKVASADFTNLDLLEHLSTFNKPLILSTGMTEDADIDQVCQFLDNLNVEFALLHCNSAYPAPYSDINLRYMQKLKNHTDIIGYSGHELGINVAIAASALGASIIEKHFTLDKTLEGVDHKVSLLPDEFYQMIMGISQVQTSLGQGNIRVKSQGELINKENLGKSVIAAKHFNVGQVIKLSDCIIKSPGVGLSPLEINNFSKKPLIKSIDQGEFFFTSHFESESVLKSKYDLPGLWGVPVRYHDFDTFMELLTPKIIEFHLSSKDMSLNPREIIKSSKKTDVIVHAPELFENDHLLDLCSVNEKDRVLSVGHMRNVIKVALDLREQFEKSNHIKIITNVGGHSDREFLTESAVNQRLEKLEISLSELNYTDVEILIQTMPPYPWHFGGQRFHNLFVNPDQILQFCTKHQMRICFDISHTKLACNTFNYEFNEVIKKLHKITGHYHIADASGVNGEGLQLGKGDILWQEVWPMITKLGLENISWIPEVWQGHKDNGAGFAKALSILEQYKK